MPVINPKTGVNATNVGSGDPISPPASSWKRFTAACSKIAASFLSESGRLCGGFFDHETPSTRFPAEGLSARGDSAEVSGSERVLVNDKGAKRVSRRRSGNFRLRHAGPEFKSSLLALQKNIREKLPTIIESDHDVDSSPPGSVKLEAGKDASSKVHLKSELLGNGLLDKFMEMGEFDFDSEPNVFRSPSGSGPVAKKSDLASQTAAVADFDFAGAFNPFGGVVESGKFQNLPSPAVDIKPSKGIQKIVDHVPATFPASRKQMQINFRGKIIAENFKATRQLNIHNEAALKRLLSTLDEFVSDENVSVLATLTPAETYKVFEHFCRATNVSPFKKGYGDV